MRVGLVLDIKCEQRTCATFEGVSLLKDSFRTNVQRLWSSAYINSKCISRKQVNSHFRKKRLRYLDKTVEYIELISCLAVEMTSPAVICVVYHLFLSLEKNRFEIYV